MSDPTPILVPVDDPEDLRAVDFANELASLTNGQIRVLAVVHDATLISKKADALKAAVAAIDGSVDIRVVVHVDVNAAIVESAVSAAAICMTTAATLLPHEGHFGSTAESVVRTLGRPVILLGPKADGQMNVAASRLVVPLDGSEAAEFIVEGAAALAKTLGAEVWVVTVVSPRQERQLDAVAGADSAILESGYVRRVAKDISLRAGIEAQFEVLHDSQPARAILEFAGPDALIAMSTHGRSGLQRIFAGSVTTKVVAGSEQPVMVVRPPEHSLVTH